MQRLQEGEKMIKTYTEDEYSKAYAELIQILQYISQDDFNKIPRDLVEFFEENKDVNYQYNYDFKIPFKKQPILKLTKILIANLYVKYWTTDYEKELIEKQENEYFIALEREKREKYNPEDIFKKKEDDIEKEETALVVTEKKNIIMKIIEKIKEKLQYLKL